MRTSVDPLNPRRVSLISRRVAAEGASDDDFLRRAGEAARATSGVVLLSGGLHECSRHSFAMWDPFLTMRARG
jgi:hypothetical protein